MGWAHALILYALLLADSNVPATARNVSIRAVGDYGDAALWNIGIVRAEHIQLKSVLGIGGQRGIRGTLRK